MAANNPHDSRARLLRAYLDAVTLSDALQTRIWLTAQLTLVQVRVLRRLAKQANHAQSLGHIGAELAVAPTSVTRLIDRLEERGLLERHRDSEDRRKVVARLTNKGLKLASAIPFLEGTALSTAVDRMTAGDRERITAAIVDFNTAVRHVEEESLLAEAQV